MNGNVKNTANGLVISKKSPIFALPTKCESTKSYIVDSTLWAYPCSTSASCGRALLAQMGDTSSFYTYTTTFDEQCQQRSKVCRRSIVTGSLPITSIGSYLIVKSCDHNSKKRISSAWKFTANHRQRLIATLRLSRPARRFWRLAQQSSSSSVAVLLSVLTSFLSLGASSRNLNPIAL